MPYRKIEKAINIGVLISIFLLIILPTFAGFIEEKILPVYTDQSVQEPFRTSHPIYGESLCWYWKSDKTYIPGRDFLSAHGEIDLEISRNRIIAIPWSWRTGQTFRAVNSFKSQDDFLRVVCLAWDGDYTQRSTARIILKYNGYFRWTEIESSTPDVKVNPPLAFRPYPIENLRPEQK